MRISRLYIPADYQARQLLSLTAEQIHYVLTVLRLKNDFKVELFNGYGQVAQGRLQVQGRRQAEVFIDEVAEVDNNSPLNTLLVQCISRGDRMDYSIQKAVELGVHHIQPLFSERCEVKLSGDKLEKRRQQWQTIAINACEQSGRTHVPEILPIIDFSDWLEQLNGADKVQGFVLDPYAESQLKQLSPPDFEQNIQILVGPEGGLSESEVEQARAHGLTAIQLGPRILRTETAGPALLAIMQALWGDF
ncbi:16S rRNA (uracil(1498)-N(3))-methyltransferase [Thiomicrorhabdus sediminis]|uniref:Ribosomal RNA small subunit methyltransferase E n=1 Tax=Thiomicrorhabdus sediminis TaxID=2580412 RepID=A0A4P9K6X3_9GAMM|nr:16S rRNA (uracil(1498)-N(3))-methyltransferase [Thiomicrorhabdus sediminis]QCU90832.1 16S rRNA (uracil(1498)-N(3))-methyltransferase [Thiomicrorhabdus sediminis]